MAASCSDLAEARFSTLPDPLPASEEIRRAVRSWRVAHIAEDLRPVLPLVEGQLAAGMRPSVVTASGVAEAEEFLADRPLRTSPVSLLDAWREVRHWRRCLVEGSVPDICELVHAHSFSCGMAAVRSCPAVVYDVRLFVEQPAEMAGQCDSPSWLARSFRVAEQFVFSRSAAVIVHTPAMKEAAVARGAAPGHSFVVPDPAPEFEEAFDGEWVRSIAAREAMLFFAADADSSATACGATLLRAFRLISEEIPEARLLVVADDSARGEWLRWAAEAEISNVIVPIAAADRPRAFACCDVVIAGGHPHPVLAYQPNATAIQAMGRGRALLAADLPGNRGVSPQGRGCLWYHDGDARDLAARAVFLARNVDFRRALGDAAFRFLEETRTPAAIARELDAVYRHAFARRRNGNGGAPFTPLRPVQVCL